MIPEVSATSGAPDADGAKQAGTPLGDLDVMILAAGLGTRMRPLTNALPKPLLPVLGRSLLAWNLRTLAASGARCVVVNTHHLAEAMEAYVEGELRHDFASPEAPPRPEVRLIREIVLLGTAGGLGHAAPLLRSDPILVWNVDLLYRPDLAAARALHEREGALATLVLTRSPLHAKIALEGNRIRTVAKEADPADPSLWAYTGVMFLSAEALAELPAEHFDELPHHLRRWAAAGRLAGHRETEPFLEVGTLESYLAVHARLAADPDLLPGPIPTRARAVDGYGYVDGDAEVAAGASIADSVVLPGARIPADVVLRRAIVGPASPVQGEIFGECHAHGETRRFPALERHIEERLQAFLQRHSRVWRREDREEPKRLHPLHGDGSGRRLVRAVAGPQSHVIVVPASGPTATASAPASSPPPETRAETPPLPIYPQRTGEDVPDEPASFVYVAGLLARRGVRVPAVRICETETGLLLVEDLGDRTLFSVLGTMGVTERRAYYHEAVELLVRLQNDALPFDPKRVSAPTYTAEFARVYECGYFHREFARGLFDLPPASPGLEAEFAALATRAAEGLPPVLIHRDYQSRNLMVTPRELAVIDFQGARLGPPLYDLASLLYDPYVDLEDELRAELQESFLRHARLDPQAASVFPSVILCRMLQALGAYGYLGGRLGKPGFLEHAPRALATVERFALPAYPHLATLVRTLSRGVGAFLRS